MEEEGRKEREEIEEEKEEEKERRKTEEIVEGMEVEFRGQLHAMQQRQGAL